MGLVHELLASNREIKRTVTRLPDGIKNQTESDNLQVVQAIKAHVDSMSRRLEDGREFNIFSKTLPVLFENRDKIHSTVQLTDKGAVVTRTSSDPKWSPRCTGMRTNYGARTGRHGGNAPRHDEDFDGRRRGAVASMP